MVKTRAISYDSGSAGKNSLIDSVTDYVEASSAGQRVTTLIYDWRGRKIVEVPPTAPFIVHKYDSENHEVARGEYSSSSGLGAGSDPTSVTSNRLALSETVYDELGRVWKTVLHEIVQGSGASNNTLDSLTWYDSRSRVIKVRGEEYTKTVFDRLGRVTDEYALASDNDSGAYAAASGVSGDIVLEEYQTRYNETKSDVLMRVTIQRKHNDFNTGETTGVLDTNADTAPLKVTAANLKGRAQITANWFDTLGRVTNTVEFGTYSAADFDRLDSGFITPPARTDLALQTTTAYDDVGTVKSVEDPMAKKTLFLYDALGRSTREVKNWDGSGPSPVPTPSGTDTNVTVANGYTNGLRTSLTAVMPSGGGSDQVTTYTFGTVKGTSPGESKIATGHLLQKVAYPDNTSGAYVVTYAYNAQGQQIWQQDQAGTLLESVYDDSGRRTINKATTLGSGIDGAIRRVESTYDALGRTISVVQYNATSGGSAKDGVAYTYDDWGNVASYAEDQDPGVSGGGAPYTTSYTWTKATTGRYTICKTAMTMPDARAITYTYSNAGGLHDQEASRVTTVVSTVAGSSPVTLAQYDYLGLATVVRTQLNEITCMSRVFDDSTPPAYVDLDEFNRLTTSRWTRDLSTDRDFYKVGLTYDRDSNIKSADDMVHVGYDVLYSVDNINRLTQAKEGNISSGSIPSPTRDEAWTLSHTGNWTIDALDLNGNGVLTDAGDLNDHRSHSEVNEITARDTDNNGSPNYSPTYDHAGNTTDDAKDYKYVYDAWNRLREVKKTASPYDTVAVYRYNGLNHRIATHEDTVVNGAVDGSDPWYYDVFDERWRQLARYRGGDPDPKEDFVPHQAGASGHGQSSYIDRTICRNKDENTAWTSASDGTLETRTYLCQNWRADVSALVKLVGSNGAELREWVKYSAYGLPIGLPGGDTDSDGDSDLTDVSQVQTWINGSAYDLRGDIDLDGDVDANDKSTIRNSYGSITLGRGVLSASNVMNRKGYAGYEQLSGLIGGKWLARNRDLAADLGRWLQRDKQNYVDGPSLYMYCRAMPLMRRDPAGLDSNAASDPTAEYTAGDQKWKVSTYTNPDPKAKEQTLCTVRESASVAQRDDKKYDVTVYPRATVYRELMTTIECCPQTGKVLKKMNSDEFKKLYPCDAIKQRKGDKVWSVQVDKTKVCVGDPCPTTGRPHGSPNTMMALPSDFFVGSVVLVEINLDGGFAMPPMSEWTSTQAVRGVAGGQ